MTSPGEFGTSSFARPSSSAFGGNPDGTVFDDFKQWATRFREPAGANPNPAFLQAGEVLAERRLQAMLQLIRTRPSDALASALSPKLRASLPPRVRRLVEEQVSGYATINRLLVCGKQAEDLSAVRLNDRLYTAYGGSAGNSSSSRVPIQGIAIGSFLALDEKPARLLKDGEDWAAMPDAGLCAGCGGRLESGTPQAKALLGGYVFALCQPGHLELLNRAVAGSEGGSVGTSPGPPPEWTLGNKSLLYIIVQYSDQGSPPTSRAVAEPALSQVSQYFQTQSYQRATVTSTVTDPVVLPQNAAYYNNSGLGQVYNHAVPAARLAGWDADDYDFVFIRHAGGPGGIGVGLVGEKGAWVKTDDWKVIAHELGHNYGLSHANGWQATTTSPYGPGSTVEYGDPYDHMGPNRGSFNPYEKCVLHWMPKTAMAHVTNSGIYRLHAFDVSGIATNQLYALRVSKDVRDYWLDYRGEFQAGEYAPFTLNGLQIRWSQWSQSRGGTTLLDTTPGTPRQFEDGPLSIGHTYSDLEARVHLTVVERSVTPGEWLDVAVHIAPSTTNQNPSASILASKTNVLIDESLTVQVSATDPDGDSLAYGWEISEHGSTAPLSLSSNSPEIIFSRAAAGDYEVRCRVSDRKGGIDVVNQWITVGSPSTYFISGSVTNPDGTPVASALVFALNPSVSTSSADYVIHDTYRSTRTDDMGHYTLVNLAAGQYVIRALPSITHTFAVSTGGSEVMVGPSLVGVDLVSAAKPLATIRGFVRDGANPVSNVFVHVAGLSTSTKPDGSFAFSNLPPASYSLAADLDDYQFIAPQNPVYLDGGDANSNAIHRVLYRISGEIRGVLGPVVVGTGEPGRSVTTLPDFSDFFKPWVYQLAVPRGLWNLESKLNGYTIGTDGFTNPVAIAGIDNPYLTANGVQATSLTNLHFNAVLGTAYTIRGNVGWEGSPISGVVLTAGNSRVVSDSLGNYFLSGLAPGDHEVVASKPGFTFSPSNAWVTVVTQDITGIDFQAARAKVQTTGLVVVSANPAVPGVPLVLSMMVSPVAPGSGTPGGSVQFKTNGVAFGVPVPLANGLAQTSGSSLSAGNYALNASYSGDENFEGTSATLAQTLVLNTPPMAGPDRIERHANQGVKVELAVLLANDVDLDGNMISVQSIAGMSVAGAMVVRSNEWVHYTPLAGFTNEDSFTYVIEDGRGGSGIGTVTVAVLDEQGVTESLDIEPRGNGMFRIRVRGIPGQSYIVQSTDGLGPTEWHDLVTITTDAQGWGETTNSPPPEAVARFYRSSRPRVP